MIQTIGPLLEQIGSELDSPSGLRDKPAGSIRVTCPDDVAEMVLRPELTSFLAEFPDTNVEITTDYGFAILSRNVLMPAYARERLSTRIMISVRLGPDWRLAAEPLVRLEGKYG